MKTIVKHSSSKFAWNVINTALGGKYLIAVIPYIGVDIDNENDPQRIEALEHAKYISGALNAAF